MTALYEMISLLPSGFVPVFSPRLNRLFLFLQSEPALEEEEATRRYLKDIKRIKYFNKLKNELKTVLTRYLIAYPSYATIKDKALFENCYHNLSIYRIFLLSYKRKAAIDIASKLLPKLLKLELHSFAHIVANDLHVHYSTIEASKILSRKYEKIADEQAEIVQAESVIRKHYCNVALIGNTRESFTKPVILQFIEATKECLPYLRFNSSHLNRLIYSIVVSRYIAEYAHEQIIYYCDKALASFPRDHPNSQSLKFTFMHKKIPALIAMGALKDAKLVAKQICQMVPPGNFNWHLALSKRVLICLHAGDYQEAYELYKAHSKESCLSEAMMEYWNILRGYIYFLIRVGKIREYEQERFSLGKFLNEMPVYSKDKAGNNINILLIQIIVLLERGHYGRIIDWVESLMAYARSYTRNPETARANLFIKMIIKMESASFHRAATERKVQKLYENLLKTPLKLGQNLAIEIIPYEILWAEVLNMLDNKFRGSNTRRKRVSI